MNDTNKNIAHPKTSNSSIRPPVEHTCADKIPPPGIIKRLPVRNILEAAIARTTARKLAEKLGYDLIDQLRLASATFELAQLLITCAGKGELVMLWYENRQEMGLKCCCRVEPPVGHITGDKRSTPKPDFSKLKKLVDEFAYIEDPQHGDSVLVTVWLKHNSQKEA